MKLVHKFKKCIFKEIIEYYTNMFQKTYDNKINYWGIQWAYSCIFNNGLAIVPGKNLISNISVTGTHTGSKPSIFINCLQSQLIQMISNTLYL